MHSLDRLDMVAVKQAVNRFTRFVGCVFELLQHDHPLRDTKHVEFFLKYDGLYTFEKTIQGVLTQTERSSADETGHRMLCARALRRLC